MLDHLGFSVRNLKVSRMFYENALKPLGIKLLMEVTPEMTGTDDSHVGFGADRPFFWIGTSDKPTPACMWPSWPRAGKQWMNSMRRQLPLVEKIMASPE